MFVHDGQVAGHHSAGAALHKVKGLFLTGGVQVIEEDAAYTSGLSSVPDVEVPIAPGGEGKMLFSRMARVLIVINIKPELRDLI